MNAPKRHIYLECLRIISILFVLFNHTNGYGFFLFANTDSKPLYVISLVLSVLCKTAVPVFFMISGALLLGRKESLKELLLKRVLKYALIILFSTSLVHIVTEISNQTRQFSLREIIKAVYRGDIGTYWFLYAYLGLMIMLPFLRGMSDVLTTKNICYLILLRILVIGLFPCIIFLALGYRMDTAIRSLIFEEPLFYFMIGYYFGTTPDNPWRIRRIRVLLLLSGFAGMGLSCFMTVYEYKVSGCYTENYLEGLLPPICILIFCAVRHLTQNSTPSRAAANVILFLGDKTFGIYLLEPVLRICLGSIWQRLSEDLPGLVASIVWCLTEFVCGILIVTVCKGLLFFGKKRLPHP